MKTWNQRVERKLTERSAEELRAIRNRANYKACAMGLWTKGQYDAFNKLCELIDACEWLYPALRVGQPAMCAKTDHY